MKKCRRILQIRVWKLLVSICPNVVALFILAGCSPSEEHVFCDFNAQITYYYGGTYTTYTDMLIYHASYLDQYIYNADSTLVNVSRITRGNAQGEYESTLTLDPGEYTVVTWGYVGPLTQIDNITVGNSVFGAGRMTNIAHSTDYPGYYAHAEQLFYATCKLSVKPGAVASVRAGTTEWHARMKVYLKGFHTTRADGDYYLHIEGVPSEYHFSSAEVRDVNVNHRLPAFYGEDGAVTGTCFSFRYRSDTHPVLSLHSKDGEQIMRPVDLYDYFELNNYQVDKMPTQYFELDITSRGPDDNSIVVSAHVDGWEMGWVN